MWRERLGHRIACADTAIHVRVRVCSMNVCKGDPTRARYDMILWLDATSNQSADDTRKHGIEIEDEMTRDGIILLRPTICVR